MVKYNAEEFKVLSPKIKANYMKQLMALVLTAQTIAEKARAGETSGNAYLWIDLYGKDSLTRSFISYIKKHEIKRIMTNYRGTKKAWYFGSQSSHGKWDGLQAICKVLNEYGINALTCDEWD